MLNRDDEVQVGDIWRDSEYTFMILEVKREIKTRYYIEVVAYLLEEHRISYNSWVFNSDELLYRKNFGGTK